MSGFKQQKYIPSQVLRPKLWNQGVSRAVLSLKVPGEGPFLPLPASGVFHQSLASWLVNAYPSLVAAFSLFVVTSASLCIYLSQCPNFSFSKGHRSYWIRAPPNESEKWKLLSPVQCFVAPWTVARKAPLSMGFFRQEHWSGLPFPSLGVLYDPGTEPGSPLI